MEKIKLFEHDKTINHIVETNWFEDAVMLDIHRSSDKTTVIKVVNKIFQEIKDLVKPSRAISRYKQALKLIILNLYIGYELGRPRQVIERQKQLLHSKKIRKITFKISQNHRPNQSTVSQRIHISTQLFL